MKYLTLLAALLLAACTATPVATQPPTDSPPVVPTETQSAPPAPSGDSPPACAEPILLYHAQLHEVLMIDCVNSSLRNETPKIIWGWNGEVWRKVVEGGPPMRVLSGAAYDSDRNVLVVYGGQKITSSDCDPQTWEWDGTTWTQKEVDTPPICDHFRLIYDASSRQVVLFGGQDKALKSTDGTWSWDGTSWTEITTEGPPSRAHFGFVYDPTHEQTLTYGGFSGRMWDDFWAWKDGAWESINFPGPGPLSHFGMALDQTSQGLLIFGGASTSSTYASLSDKTWLLTGGAWSELSLDTAPSVRGSPGMVADPDRGVIVLYGGFDANGLELGDTWEWDGASWLCIANCP